LSQEKDPAFVLDSSANSLAFACARVCGPGSRSGAPKKLGTSGTCETGSLSHVQLSVSLVKPSSSLVYLSVLLIGLSVMYQALIDSGAAINLIHEAIVQSLGLETFVCSPIQVVLANGKTLTHANRYVRLKYSIAGVRHEDVFLVAPIGINSIIFGMPFLERLNPAINWRRKTVTFPLAEEPESSSSIPSQEPESCSPTTTQASEPRTKPCKRKSRSKSPKPAPEPKPKPPPPPVRLTTRIGPRDQVYLLTLDEIVPLNALSDSGPTDLTKPQIPKEYSDFADVFSEEQSNALPPHRGTLDHHIPLEEGAKPVYGPIYNLSETELQVLKEYIETHLQRGFIRPSTSPFGSPVLFVKKPDGSLRLCVDYRALNRITVKNRYPLPLISELLDRVRRAKWFTKLDLRSAFHQLRIAQGDEWKTAFRTRYGHFEYLVMPFGLTNAPASFQAYANDCLREYLDKFCVAYLDDILIYSDSLEEHIQHVRMILQRLRECGLYVKLEKCDFHVQEISFLGFIISPDGVSMDPKRIATIVEWPVPESVHDVQVFLGFANFYRRFIEKYSRVVLPITSLLRKGQPFVWTPKAQAAFDELKSAFSSAPILRHFDPELPISLHTDSSGFALSGILSQLFEGEWHPVAFWSRKCITAECNYDIHDREMLAIVESMKHWRHYLEGSKYSVRVYSDHKNLESFMTTKMLNRRQARWAEILAGYDFVLVHTPGEKNPADGPSRRPDYAQDVEVPSGALIPPKALRLLPPHLVPSSLTTSMPLEPQPRIPESQAPDLQSRSPEPQPRIPESQAPDLQSRSPEPEPRSQDPLSSNPGSSLSALLANIVGVHANTVPELGLRERIIQALESDAVARQHRENPKKPWSWQDGLLLHDNLVYIPHDDAVRVELVSQHHDAPLAGHYGETKTLELLSRNYYFPGMQSYVKDYVSTCDLCSRGKPLRHRRHGELAPLPVPTIPWKGISCDFVVDLPLSKGYDSILVFVDRLTKMCHLVPCNKTATAPEFAQMFLTNVIRLHGIPDSLVSDRGSIFTSHFWKSLSHMLGIKPRLSTAFHPQTDGQTERMNQTIETYLRIYCNYQQDNWSDLLALAEFAYNNAYQESIRCSPFYANYGYHPEFHVNVQATSTSTSTLVPAAQDLADRFKALHEELVETVKTSQNLQAKYYDAKHKPIEFKPGDKVWLLTPNIRTERPSKKLDWKRIGPYPVVERIGTQAYRLQLPPSFKIHSTFHVSLLEPYKASTNPARTQPPPPPVTINRQPEFEVEEVLNSKIEYRKLYYLVKWKGYSVSDNSWEPPSHLKHCQDLVRDFHSRYPDKPGPTSARRQRKRKVNFIGTQVRYYSPILPPSSISA
jgi:RNase H-like domain found in reverse transcriptase/Reverse transcriptase (RNA-dependent DNA polymerase)/Integrase zinc binding domain/Chromo (CHRromatin Organisation MOdifier) domain/Integrase core domain